MAIAANNRKAARAERRSARNGVSASVAVLLALTMLAVGVAGGFLLTRSKIPPSLVSGGQAGTVVVATSRFDDARSVTLTVTLGESATVTSPVSGTVTATRLGAGAVVASGDAAFDVDATPVIALHTGVPMYRTIVSGTQGTDVAGLNAALRRLGYAAPDSDWFTWDTIAAYNALADSRGAKPLTQDDGWSIGPDRFVWLPAETVTVRQSSVAVGRRVEAGTDLFETAATPLKATVPVSATDSVAGERTLVVGDQSFAVPAGAAELTDPALLAAIGGSMPFRMALTGMGAGASMGDMPVGASGGTSGGGTVTVAYDWRLAQPLTALTVPPSALYGVAGGSGCVSVDAEPVAVTIIASQLGRTMVGVGDGAQPFDHVDVTPRTDVACAVEPTDGVADAGDADAPDGADQGGQ